MKRGLSIVTPAHTPAPFTEIFRFQRGDDVVVVRAQDIGYAVQLWTQTVVGKDFATREMSRFHDPDALEQEVQRIKAKYLADGWALL